MRSLADAVLLRSLNACVDGFISSAGQELPDGMAAEDLVVVLNFEKVIRFRNCTQASSHSFPSGSSVEVADSGYSTIKYATITNINTLGLHRPATDFDNAAYQQEAPIPILPWSPCVQPGETVERVPATPTVECLVSCTDSIAPY
jgi:hypothetical protein